MNDLADLDWDHVRVFLATMRAGSLRGAAQRLGLSHPAARRRLGALEEQLGLQLFERRRDGLHPTKEATELQSAAEGVERAVLALGRAVQAVDPSLRGPIRVSLPAMLATDLLMADLVGFAQRWPEIELHLEDSTNLADLDRREADVALRVLQLGTLPEEHLAGRHAATGYRAVYGEGDCWIGWGGPDADAAWVKGSEFPDLPVRGALSSAVLHRSACAAGLGLTRLPCFFAEPRLKRRTTPVPSLDIWVLVHPDLRRNPRMRAFRDTIVEAIERCGPRLEGRTGGSSRQANVSAGRRGGRRARRPSGG